MKKCGYNSTSGLSIEMGYSESWIRTHLHRHQAIPKTVRLYLESKHGIGYDEYKPIPQKNGNTLTTEEFRALVREAVRDAVREILEERRKDGI